MFASSGREARGDLEMAERVLAPSARQQDLAEQVAGVGVVGLDREYDAQLRQRLVALAVEIEHGGERVSRREFFGWAASSARSASAAGPNLPCRM